MALQQRLPPDPWVRCILSKHPMGAMRYALAAMRLLPLILLAMACTGDFAVGDTGVADTGVAGGGARDTGPSDAPVRDAPDSEVVDANAPDEADLGAPDATEAGSDVDAGPPPVTLVINNAAEWRGQLVLTVVVFTLPEAEPLRLAAESFAVETDGGRIFDGLRYDAPSTFAPCDSTLIVAPGGNAFCHIAFEPEPASGRPIRATLQVGAQQVSAPIQGCSLAAPGGLCQENELCASGTCTRGCAPDNFGALCLPGDRCDDGVCTDLCAPSNPDGPCDDGVCTDGACL
ncbi:MAG: hypothetical protein AAF645_16395 [Myxococcota bacterium]